MKLLAELFRKWSGEEPTSMERLPGAGSNRAYYRMTASKGHTVVGSLAWQPLDALRVAAKGVMNRATDLEETFWTGGLEASWFPLKESENLRLQAMAGYSNGLGYALMGLTWRFDLKLW